MRKMHDGKKIALSNQCLTNLRANLRNIINSARKRYRTEISKKLLEITKILIEKKNANNEKIEEEKELIEKKKTLDSSFNKSILICGTCNTLEGDRIYYKRFDKWYCPNCFEENIKHWAQIDWVPKYPLSKNQVISFFEALDKVVGLCQTNFNLSKEILTGMDISKSNQKIFLDTLYHYGGHCDCEIMLNAAPNVLADFNIEENK